MIARNIKKITSVGAQKTARVVSLETRKTSEDFSCGY
jgi:hypothetical protein